MAPSISEEPDMARSGGPPPSRREEIVAFIVLAVLIWPIIAVGIVGGYGFLVWMFQLLYGPPGPPAH
ncbi:periplasmic nitrate reductase subunit NapE [Ancylobacter aquaticus]|jgi:nitrate reductase NapE|uniref:Periplasmic nitrate reductase subunit NapE n=2 Tax=Xanthobacteraceae TaxID=335928 RepID=A0A4V2PH73_ANCAQ|nr:periplasmic nitrate reductase subunit NapE [Ancylobacter aquaticus]